MGAPVASDWFQWAPGHGERDTLLFLLPQQRPGKILGTVPMKNLLLTLIRMEALILYPS